MANTQPIFSRTPDIQSISSATTANTAVNGLAVGTSYQVFVADATNGGYVQRIRFRPLGTNVATVARVWVGSGATSTATNYVIWDEITLAATTVSQVAALFNYELPLNFGLPPTYTIYVTLGTTVAAGYDITVIGGKF